ncbi:hypothetical protein EW145_g64 [Phellinidium pouzarii]|uniref:Uncharacterized protein n=1 Tax=Phellinidium pouzarii TaxID=167371 RepID=A0A4S4LLU2_9AGAM|nr:hypothetical protein EW145_g64 [Phellinidium pouzarii]
MGSKLACKSLVLDAGPLLSLSPLRGLAEHFLTVPQVLSELKDKNAREHFERLGLSVGVKIEVREPDAASLSQVIQFAKKTGDYSVLSHADLCVLALTLALDTQGKAEHNASEVAEKAIGAIASPSDAPIVQETASETMQTGSVDKSISSKNASKAKATDLDIVGEPEEIGISAEDEVDTELEDKNEEAGQLLPVPGEELPDDDAEREPLDVALESISRSPSSPLDSNSQDITSCPDNAVTHSRDKIIFEDPLDEDDGEGEWITPANVDMYKSRALELVPSADSTDPFATVSFKKGDSKGKRKQQNGANGAAVLNEQIKVGCMTADFAMQNVLLQMGLSLVGVEGKRIEKVKTWVLRCHACYKLCKDATKKFCPFCGNPTLLRTSVTAKTPTADNSTPTLQSEYMRAKSREDGRREREDKKILQRTLQAARGGETTGLKLGNWMDPDWVPDMLSVGIGGKGRRAPDGRTSVGPNGMPVIGHGRRNPNERRRKV